MQELDAEMMHARHNVRCRWHVALRWNCFLFGVALLAPTSRALAAPNNADPHAAIEVRKTAECEDLQRRAAELYQQVRIPVELFMQRKEKGELRLVKPRAIGEAHGANLKLDRLAKRLIYWGEPAGVDFELRSAHMARQIQEVIEDYRVLPSVSAQLSQGYRVLRSDADKRAKVLVKVAALVKDEEWDAAETELFATLDELSTMAVWYDSRQQIAVLNKYFTAARIVQAGLENKLRAQAQTGLTEERQALLPDFQNLLNQLQTARESVGQTGKADWDGGSLSGPELLTAVGGRWQELHHQTMQCQGLDWARGLSAGGRNGSELNELRAAHQTFSEQIVAGLAELVVADANRVAEAAAKPLYVAYLKALGPLAPLSDGDALGAAVAQPLQLLAAKSPSLASEAAAYEAATTDLLRWRKRVAAAYAQSLEATFPPLEEKYFQAVQVQPGQEGLVGPRAKNTAQTELLGPAPQVIETATPNLVGQTVALTNLTGLSDAKKLAIGPYRARAYSQLELPPGLAEQVDLLRHDLHVDEAHPPLTLEAATALASADRGDLMIAGGEITGIFLEGLAPRFASLKSAGWTLMPLGPLPAEPTEMVPMRQVVMRFAVRPSWVCHQYFFLAASSKK